MQSYVGQSIAEMFQPFQTMIHFNVWQITAVNSEKKEVTLKGEAASDYNQIIKIAGTRHDS